ncbi:MAG: hypothetical protein DRO88_07495 [Promethearchaeia archaeon]|nr:MAG: hypothetical protein DRO88_07495 [Candidatus Lokiarchaeia archaeon]
MNMAERQQKNPTSAADDDPDLYSNGKLIRHLKKKVLVLGDGGVGKTTLLYRYVNNVFIDSTKMTIGSDFVIKKLKIVDDNFENRLTLLFWDFSGQERFRFILKEYAKGAEGVLLVFDLTRFNSLSGLYEWVKVLKDGGIWNDPKVKYILVGTKSDLLVDGSSKIDDQVIQDFCDEFKITKYFETSAKSGDGVEDLFAEVAHEMISKED